MCIDRLSTKQHRKKKIARADRLLGKILIDLRNTRQEALSVAELKHSQESSDISSNFGDDECDSAKRCRRMSDDSRKSNEQALDPEDHDGKETQYRLDPKYFLPVLCLKKKGKENKISFLKKNK
jgi:inositol hexakisphosphate/diphosphoinositol-pentakisphosphate kinase